MMAVIFDTLAYAKKLKAVGVPEQQAEVQAEALAEIVSEQVATKRDLHEVKSELEVKLVQTKSEIMKWILTVSSGQTAILMAFIALSEFLH